MMHDLAGNCLLLVLRCTATLRINSLTNGKRPMSYIDCDYSPLSALHNMLASYRGDLSIPHYIVVSTDFLEHMREVYTTQNFSVRGHIVIADKQVRGGEAFLFPESMWEDGTRPWSRDE